jgi:Fe-S oxidoreductase
MDWAKDLSFNVPVVGEDVADLSEVEYLFWVGCAGAYEDRAQKTTRAVAELLLIAGVSYAVLGNGETCTGDPARRSGNEFVYQQLAMQNAETLQEAQATKIVVTCAHCLNALKNEYPQLGLSCEVVHHTQLLNRLVRDGRLTGRAARGLDCRTHDHLPRRLLSGTAQRDLRSATRLARLPPGCHGHRDAPNSRAILLLRCRRCPDVDGGADRYSNQ